MRLASLIYVFRFMKSCVWFRLVIRLASLIYVFRFMKACVWFRLGMRLASLIYAFRFMKSCVCYPSDNPKVLMFLLYGYFVVMRRGSGLYELSLFCNRVMHLRTPFGHSH